jgi:hypothetical protein
MNRAGIEALLERLAPDLDAHAAPWALIGSAALMLLGVPLEAAGDLDVVTDPAGAARLRSAWARWLQPGEPHAPDGPFRSDDFARYATPWGLVEVMGGLRVRQGGELRPLVIVGGPIPAAHEQLRILRLFGRPKDLDKAARLEAWLAAG